MSFDSVIYGFRDLIVVIVLIFVLYQVVVTLLPLI